MALFLFLQYVVRFFELHLTFLVERLSSPSNAVLRQLTTTRRKLTTIFAPSRVSLASGQALPPEPSKVSLVCRDILVTLGLTTNTLSIGALLGAFFMLGSTRKSTIN